MSISSRPIRLVDEPGERMGPVPILDASGAMEVLRTASRIAIVGASPHLWRPSHSVMRYLLGHGYECVPVTPKANEILGQPCYATLKEAVAAGSGKPFDIVNVFRRPEHTPDIARSAVALGCGALWLQQGVISWDAARIAHEGGLGVVMDRCSAVEHRHLRSVSG